MKNKVIEKIIDFPIKEIIKNNLQLAIYEQSTRLLKKYKSKNWIATKIKIPFKNNNNNKGALLNNIIYDLKDNIVTKNITTRAGSKILESYIPSYSATIYQLLSKEKAFLFSKSLMDELGQGDTGINEHYGKIRNIFNDLYSAHGSSGGAASLVASRIVQFAIGTDTGDSIRIPAAVSGIIGFKPSWGIISRYGIIPYSPSLDTPGILTRHIEDTLYVFRILAKKDFHDLTSIEIKESNDKISENSENITFIDNLNVLIKNKEYKDKYLKLKQEVENTFNNINNMNIDDDVMSLLLITYKIIANCESISCCANLNGLTFGNSCNNNYNNWKDIYSKTRSNGFSLQTKTRFLFGLYATSGIYEQKIYKIGITNRIIIKNYINIIFDTTDFIITPILTNGPSLFNETRKKTIFSTSTNHIDDFLLFSNFASLPSITIPFFKSKNGFSYSIAITSKHLNDYNLLFFTKKLLKIINKINNGK